VSRALAEQPAPPKGFEFARGILLLSRWDYNLVVRAISDLCLHTEGETWEEVATSLSRDADWEFADYRD
jgi:Immunity protein 8